MIEHCNLPIPYPDELLYSVLTRYHLRSNNTSPKWTLREIFGTENVIPTIDLPSHLNILAARNGSVHASADQWIVRHTLYPFYAPFLPKNRANRLRKLMKSQNGSGIHTLVGITASTMERSSDLRLCLSCYEHDIQQFGEPYWHRIHQLPGVWVCPRHKIILHKITYPVSERFGLTILPISQSMFRSVPIADRLPDQVLNHLIEVALDIQMLIQTKETLELHKSRDIIMTRMVEQGFVTGGMRIRQQKLEEQFVRFYGQSLLAMLECLPHRNDYSWLALATRVSVRRAVHPLRMILLYRFLYGSFHSFLEQSGQAYAPFGKKPWPCLNKAADHYKRRVITICQISRCTDTGKPVGTFICECGFSYSRRGPDQTEDDRFRRGRITSFGLIWTRKLQECQSKGLSYRASAKVLGVDTNTVIKYANGAETDRNIEVSKANKEAKSIVSRKARPRSYKRVDWEKRDLELSWLVEEACKAMLSDNHAKPTRVTIAAIGKRIRKLSLLEKHKHRLPITMKILTPHLESVTEFQIRRVQWAADQMSDEWPLKRWKLIKKAGLSPGFSPEVSAELDRCIVIGVGTSEFSSNEVTPWLH